MGPEPKQNTYYVFFQIALTELHPESAECQTVGIWLALCSILRISNDNKI